MNSPVVARERGDRPCELLARRPHAPPSGPRGAGEDGLGDECERARPGRSAAMTVHLPVPFWPAVSRIRSTIGLPVSGSLKRDSRGDLDQIAVQRALVPVGEDVVHGGGSMPSSLHEQ